MADARITYDSKTIDLKKAPIGLNPEWVQDQNKNTASSGIVETINIYDMIQFRFTGFFSQQIYYDLIPWWAWAKQGQVFSFAFDSDRMFSTTLDAGAAAAQKAVPLTATAGSTVGDFLYLKKASDDEQEVIEIDAIDPGVDVDAVENLKYTYVSGDECRHVDYYPAALADFSKFNPTVTNQARPVTSDHYYRFTFRFKEDKS